MRQDHHRVERRAEPTSIAVHVISLSFFGPEAVVINIARLGNHPIERTWQLRRSGLLVVIIGLNFDHVAQVGETEWYRRWRDSVGILGEKAELVLVGDRELHFLFEFS